ncbi:hypothetical protein GOL22_14075 [Sinorhizobium medicae]|nr:hypothetical protein [Sinorhizobium medicae]
MAFLMLPLAIVASNLLQAGARPPVAFLCGFGASALAIYGGGYLAMLADEKFNYRVIAKETGEMGLYGVLLTFALCFAGSWVVASLASAIF